MRDIDWVDRKKLYILIDGLIASGHSFKVKGRRLSGDLKKISIT